MEAKKSHGGFVLLKFPVKKVMILVVVGVIGVNGTTHALGTSKRFIMKHDVLFLVQLGLVAQMELHLLVHNPH